MNKFGPRKERGMLEMWKGNAKLSRVIVHGGRRPWGRVMGMGQSDSQEGPRLGRAVRRSHRARP